MMTDVLFRHGRLTLVMAIAAAVVMVAHPVFADMSREVGAAFRGQLVISKDDLPEGRNDKDTIAKIKRAQLKALVGTTNDSVTSWHFHYTAFLEKTGARALTLKFMSGDRMVADKRLTGVDPKSAVLTGDIAIDTDEDLARGKTYTLELADGKRGVVARTTLKMR